MNMDLALPRAVTAKTPASHLTDRYVFVDSEEVVNLMMEEGFILADIKIGRGAGEHGKHLLDFRHIDAPMIAHGEAVPRVMFGNSHDGTSKAFAMAGLFRLICSNGLTVGEPIYHERLRHVGDAARTLVERMKQMAKETAPLAKTVEDWRKKILTESQMRDFARKASELRWNDPDKFDLSDILKPRREEDDNSTLWTVFNRVQENTVMGGIHGQTRNGRTIISRPISAIGRDLSYNQKLWQLAKEFA